jgi:AcrR family transcriptional regulator
MVARGRPKKFNNFEALEKAMEVFWDKGYEAASLPDLIQAMGISRQSMYNTFGNKRDLFLQTLEYYTFKSGQHLADQFNGPSHAEDKIAGFIDMMTGAFCNQGGKGCFASGAIHEMAAKDAEVKRILDTKYDKNSALFEEFYTKAIENGEITSDLSGKELADLFDSILLGVTGLCKLPNRCDQIQNIFKIFLKQMEFVRS